MKRMITVLVLTVLTCITQSFAAPARLPVGSQDDLRQYALSMVTNGSRYVTSSGMDWGHSDSLTYTNLAGKYAEDVLDKLFDVEFRYWMVNTNDLIRGYVWLYDVHQAQLFFGYAEYTQADVLGTNMPQYDIWMNDIPIGTNVQSAEILVLDEDGHTARTIPVQIDAWGRMMFPSWMAGSVNGVLVVRYADGSVFYYNLWNPRATSPGALEEDAKFKIDGHYIYQNVTNEATVKIIETWTRPSVFLKVTSGRQNITFDVLGLVQESGHTSFERPAAIEVTDQDGRVIQIKLPANGVGQVSFPVGTYRITFDWVKFGQGNYIYTGPDGGVKGKAN